MKLASLVTFANCSTIKVNTWKSFSIWVRLFCVCTSVSVRFCYLWIAKMIQNIIHAEQSTHRLIKWCFFEKLFFVWEKDKILTNSFISRFAVTHCSRVGIPRNDDWKTISYVKFFVCVWVQLIEKWFGIVFTNLHDCFEIWIKVD